MKRKGIVKIKSEVSAFFSEFNFDGVLFLNFIKIFLIYTISVSIVSSFVIINNIRNINDDIHQEIIKDGEKIADTLLNQYNGVKTIVGSLAIDINIRNFINGAMSDVLVESNDRAISEKILMYKNISKCIDTAVLYSNKNKQVLYYDKKISLEDFTDRDCIEQYYKDKNDTMQVMLRKSVLENKEFITFISGLNGFGIDGAVFVNIDIAKLRNSLGDFITPDSDFYILSGDDIVFCKENELLFKKNTSEVIKKAVKSRGIIKNDGIYAAYVNSDFGNGWECVYTVARGAYANLFWNNNSGMVLLLFASLLLGVVFSFILSINISKPITNLVEIINKYSKGGKSDEEIINISQLGTRIISIMESNTELKREVETRLSEYRKLQMVALQTQINPHFIYNTLNIISLSAIIQSDNGEQVSKLLNDVAKLIRYTYDSEKTVTVRHEVMFLRGYTELMQKCYPNIEFAMDIDDAVLEYKVVRICIQPLIENAIYHGMAGEKKGRIELKITGDENRLLITVADNGNGMGEERMGKILASIDNDDTPQINIGLGNIYKRLKLVFGEDVRFEIDSEYSNGTIIRIELPRI